MNLMHERYSIRVVTDYKAEPYYIIISRDQYQQLIRDLSENRKSHYMFGEKVIEKSAIKTIEPVEGTLIKNNLLTQKSSSISEEQVEYNKSRINEVKKRLSQKFNFKT